MNGGQDRAVFAQGLDSERAARLLAEFGPNESAKPRVRSLGAIVVATLREPMFLLLVLAAGLYLAMGDLAEGLLLCVGAFISIALVIVEEARNETALAALRELAAPMARVVRDGFAARIPSRDIVPGDIVLVGDGERAPADAALIDGDALLVDESVLTGESVPVSKAPASQALADDDPEPGGDGLAVIFSGTMILRGQGVARVLRTGAATRLGRIGAALEDISREPTLLQKTTSRLVGYVGLFAVAFCMLVVVVYGLTRGDWMEAALAGITLAISLVPEEFPMVLAVFLALGSWRLARSRVLTRRPAVIETLGATSMLCVDKTGTLTGNHLTLAALWNGEGFWRREDRAPIGDEQAGLLGFAARAAPLQPADPLDRALLEAAHDMRAPALDGVIVRTEPIRADRPVYVEIWRLPSGGILAAAKGAPEAILTLCAVDAALARRVLAAVAELAAGGLRVLAVAVAHGGEPEQIGAYGFKGLIGFLDPVRGDVPAALAAARRAGVGVAMITGDYPATALEIARRAGIDVAAGVLTGADIAALTMRELAERARHIRVFARVRPEQKLQIVEAFKSLGHIVAMTGDGVNDAPALESAHIGVAMGKRGSDVAREAADIVLLDDAFASIIVGVGLGRRIFSNLRKALTYVTAIHVPIAGLALAPLLAGLPPILFPAHVMVLELIIDPVCALVFEGKELENGAMDKPPRDPAEALFGWRQIGMALAQGLGLLAGIFALYFVVLRGGAPEAQARAVAFLALVAANLTLAFAVGGAPRAAFWLIVGAAATVVTAALFVAPIAALFRFAAPDATLVAAAFATALVVGGWPALHKRRAESRAAIVAGRG